MFDPLDQSAPREEPDQPWDDTAFSGSTRLLDGIRERLWEARHAALANAALDCFEIIFRDPQVSIDQLPEVKAMLAQLSMAVGQRQHGTELAQEALAGLLEQSLLVESCGLSLKHVLPLAALTGNLELIDQISAVLTKRLQMSDDTTIDAPFEGEDPRFVIESIAHLVHQGGEEVAQKILRSWFGPCRKAELLIELFDQSSDALTSFALGEANIVLLDLCDEDYPKDPHVRRAIEDLSARSIDGMLQHGVSIMFPQSVMPYLSTYAIGVLKGLEQAPLEFEEGEGLPSEFYLQPELLSEDDEPEKLEKSELLAGYVRGALESGDSDLAKQILNLRQISQPSDLVRAWGDFACAALQRGEIKNYQEAMGRVFEAVQEPVLTRSHPNFFDTIDYFCDLIGALQTALAKTELAPELRNELGCLAPSLLELLTDVPEEKTRRNFLLTITEAGCDIERLLYSHVTPYTPLDYELRSISAAFAAEDGKSQRATRRFEKAWEALEGWQENERATDAAPDIQELQETIDLLDSVNEGRRIRAEDLLDPPDEVLSPQVKTADHLSGHIELEIESGKVELALKHIDELKRRLKNFPVEDREQIACTIAEHVISGLFRLVQKERLAQAA